MTDHSNAGRSVAIIGAVSAVLIGAVLLTAREHGRRLYIQESASTSPTPPAGWRNKTVADPMSNTPVQLACTFSNNVVELPWPYGKVRAELCFRRSERHGLDAFVEVTPKAIIICRADGCRIGVRSGESAMTPLNGSEPVSGAPNIAFFDSPGRLRRTLHGSHYARIELTFLDYGAAVFWFDTDGGPTI